MAKAAKKFVRSKSTIVTRAEAEAMANALADSLGIPPDKPSK